MSGTTAAIMARLGLDSGDFNKELAASATKANAGGKQIAGGLNLATEAHERLLGSSKRVAHQITNVAQAFTSGASAADIATTGIIALEKALRLPLGALAGLGLGALAVGEIHKSVLEAKKLHEELSGLSTDNTPAASRTTSDIEHQLEKAKELRETLSKQLQHPFWEATKDIVTGPFAAAFGGDPTSNSGRKQQAQTADEQEAKFKGLLVDKEKALADISDKRLRIGELAAEEAKLELDYAEKIGAAKKLDGHGVAENAALVPVYEAELATAKQAIAIKREAQTREVAFEERILEIKTAGVDVDAESARAKVDKLQGDLTGTSTEAKPKAQAALDAAKQELVIAERITAASKLKFAAETEIAELQGSEMDKRQQMLAIQKAEIEGRLQNAVGDAKNPIKLELAANKNNFDAVAKQAAEAAEANTVRWQQSSEGKGTAEKVRVLNLAIDSTQRLIDMNRTSGDYDAAYDAEKSEALTQQIRHRDELLTTQEATLTAAKATTTQMELEASGQASAAREAGIRANYEAQIKTALENQNTELATQLTTQRNIAIQAEKIANFMKSPEQKAKEAQDARDKKRAGSTVESRDRDKRSRGVDADGNAHGPEYQSQLGGATGEFGHRMDPKGKQAHPHSLGDKVRESAGVAGSAAEALKNLDAGIVNAAVFNVAEFKILNK